MCGTFISSKFSVLLRVWMQWFNIFLGELVIMLVWGSEYKSCLSDFFCFENCVGSREKFCLSKKLCSVANTWVFKVRFKTSNICLDSTFIKAILSYAATSTVMLLTHVAESNFGQWMLQIILNTYSAFWDFLDFKLCKIVQVIMQEDRFNQCLIVKLHRS